MYTQSRSKKDLAFQLKQNYYQPLNGNRNNHSWNHENIDQQSGRNNNTRTDKDPLYSEEPWLQAMSAGDSGFLNFSDVPDGFINPADKFLNTECGMQAS